MIGGFVLMFVLPIGRDVFELDTTERWAYLMGAAAIAAAFPLLLIGGAISQRIASSGYMAKRRAARAASSN